MQPLPVLPTSGLPVEPCDNGKPTGSNGRLDLMISEILSTVQNQEVQNREIREQMDQLRSDICELPKRILRNRSTDFDSKLRMPVPHAGDNAITSMEGRPVNIEALTEDLTIEPVANNPQSHRSLASGATTSCATNDSMQGDLRRTKLAKVNLKNVDAVESFSFHYDEIPSIADGKFAWLESFIRWIVHMKNFEYLTSSVIIVNSILIGIRIQYDIKGLSATTLGQVVQGSEIYFLGIYTLELFLRFFADGRAAFYNPWIAFDGFLVFCGLISECIIEPIKAANKGNSSTLDILKKIIIFRVLRIMRLLRPLRLISHFRIIWRLVSGLFNSAGTILSTLALLLVVIYIAACLGVEFITKDETLLNGESTQWIVELYFADLPTTMLTLFQFVTLDSISAIYFELIKSRPMLCLYFVGLVLLMSISLMNLVTAVLVEAGIESSRRDKELAQHAKRQRMGSLEPEVRSAFRRMDTNSDRTLTMEEVLESYDLLPESVIELVKPDSLLELFDMLDEDESGEVSEGEFVTGLLNAATSEVPIEMQQVLEMLRGNRRSLRKVEKDIRGMNSKLKALTPSGCSDARLFGRNSSASNASASDPSAMFSRDLSV